METTGRTSHNGKWALVALFFLIIFGILWYSVFSAPSGATSSVMIHVTRNESVTEIADELSAKDAIRYPLVLKALISFFKSDKQIAQGDYLFAAGEPVYGIAWQIASSRHDVLPLKITLKEGITDAQIANQLSAQLPDFNQDAFLGDPQVKQGYLFPDTYFFFPLTTTQEVVDELTSNFTKKITALSSDINASGKSESDIIIMASLVEKEAEGKDDAPTIAGILWKRIALGMPLQVDAAPATYTQKGLPNEPIDNPGLVSIDAALHPVDSPYLFYLHDKNGMVHYATTFAEHKANIARYLQ
jgi:UPF0755 protein